MEIHHFLHFDLEHKHFHELKQMLQQLLERTSKMSAELDTLETEVSETRTVVDSAVVLIQGLKAALDAAGTDPAKLRALSDSLNTQQADLAAAVAANTPAAP